MIIYYNLLKKVNKIIFFLTFIKLLCNKGLKGDYDKSKKWLRDISLNTQTILYLSK